MAVLMACSTGQLNQGEYFWPLPFHDRDIARRFSISDFGIHPRVRTLPVESSFTSTITPRSSSKVVGGASIFRETTITSPSSLLEITSIAPIGTATIV